MADGFTTGDLALMKDNDSFGGSNGFLLFFVIMMMMFGIGAPGRGGAPGGDYVTHAELTNGFNNQATQAQLQQIALSSANNNYETAQLINNQTNAMLQQNNTNLINAIQGFNQMNVSLMNQTNVLSQQLQALSSKLDECCCSIKTQMLQDRLADRDTQLAAANNALSNANQSQYLLGQLGRFVAWSASGTQGGTTPATT